MIQKEKKSVFGIFTAGDPGRTDSVIRAALNQGYNQPILFNRPGDLLSDFAKKFEVIPVADQQSAVDLLRARFKSEVPLLNNWQPAVDLKTDVDISDPTSAEIAEPAPIRVGFVLHGLAFGGISRHVLTMMEAPCTHRIEWAGIAISTLNHMDFEVVERIRRYCPVYAVNGNHLVEKSENPYQSVVDLSDVICLSSFIQPEELFGKTDWQNKPIVTTAHGQCDYSVRQIETALKYGGKKICLAVSQAAVNVYPAELQNQVRVIYNGVNYSRCAPVVDRETVRSAWGIDEDTKAIGYLGRLAHDKNPLAAAQAVAALGAGYHAVYLGSGYAEEKLRYQIRELCGDHCTIREKTEDIGSQLAALDCLVMASPLEGGPMIVAEAWLAGCPVVSTPVGMIPELEAKHGALTCRLPVNPSLDDLVTRVKLATTEPHHMTAWAREVAWQTFNPSKMVLEFERAIRDGLTNDNPLPTDDRIRVGFCIGTCSMGGVTRGIITLMDQGCPGLQWSGVAIEGPGYFDPETARSLLKHGPIYYTHDDPRFEGLVTIVPNACQAVVDRSDVVKLWGSIHTRPELDQVDWNRVTVITAAHGQCEWTRKNIDVSLLYGSRHLLYSVSEAGKHCFPEALRDQVHVIYNGLPFTRAMSQRSREQLRAEWNVDSESAVVAYLGRFELGGKNPLAAARAVAELGNKYHALYVGEGVNQAEVLDQVKQLCGDNCTFLPRTEDIGSILAAVDCIVLASPSEGCPQIMMEAFAAQCPVVSTRVGFLPEFEPEFGKLTYEVPFDPSPAELAAAVKSAVCDVDGLTDKACAVAMQKFNSRKYAREFENMVRNGTVVNL